MPHGAKFYFRDNGTAGDKIEHLTVRLFGALLLAQAFIAFHARSIADDATKRMLVQAYFGFFALAALAHLRAMLTPGTALSAWNWLNILALLGLGERRAARAPRGANTLPKPHPPPPPRSGRLWLVCILQAVQRVEGHWHRVRRARALSRRSHCERRGLRRRAAAAAAAPAAAAECRGKVSNVLGRERRVREWRVGRGRGRGVEFGLFAC